MKKISDFNNATEKYPVVYAGSATRPEFVDMPTVLQQQEGVAPMDTCPAQWWNAMWKLATKDINAFRDYVGDAFTEINNLLTEFGITLADSDTEQLYDFFHNDYVQNYLSTFFVNKNGDTIDGDLHIKGDLSVDGIGEEIISTELKVGANTITLRNDNPSALGNTELAGVVTENYDGNNHNNIIAINKNGVARVGDIDIATRILYSNDGTNFYTDEDLTTPATIGATEEVRDTGNQTSGGIEIYEGITYSNNDTQPLLTRAESNSLNDGHYLKWDATNQRAVDGGVAIDMFYPIGSIYWTGKAPDDGGNPNVLFGGTWVQIKDRFIWAKGDNDTLNATGGAKTVTLTTNQMPSHTHSGTTDSGGVDHTHEMDHRHYTGNGDAWTPVAGSITIPGDSNYTATQQSASKFSSNVGGGWNTPITVSYGAWSTNARVIGNEGASKNKTGGATAYSHIHDFTTGSAGGSDGVTQAHENMPPYIVKYCWERTA